MQVAWLANRQTLQDHLIRVHEIKVEAGSSQTIEIKTVAIEDMSGITIPPFESQTTLSAPTTLGATIEESGWSLVRP